MNSDLVEFAIERARAMIAHDIHMSEIVNSVIRELDCTLEEAQLIIVSAKILEQHRSEQ